MFSSKKLNITSLIITIAAIAVGLLSLVWSLIFLTHEWNHVKFRENFDYDEIFGPLCIALILLIVFWACNYFLKRKLTNKICKLLLCITYTLQNIGAIVIFIISIYASLDFSRDYSNYKLDNQLSSNDIVKVHEAIDSIIARSNNHYLYRADNVNEYIMKAARDGYARAQYYVGVFFYEQAKKQNDSHFGYEKWDRNETTFCQENLNRATYWWLKAANQDYGQAQENLGRMKMKSILSNQPYDFEEARFWLTEATKNGVVSAYYYLGLLCKDISLADAVQYWKMGAEKGNEDCNRMLENPVFIDVTVNRQN